MPFPQTHLRRLRATRALRGLVRETNLAPSDFVYPMFVAHGIDRREPIDAMPGVDRLSIAHAVAEAAEAQALGIPGVLLFGLPAAKDEEGSGAWDDEGIVQLATRAIKERHPDLIVIADLFLLPTVWPRAFLEGDMVSRIIALTTLAAIVPGVLATRRAATVLVVMTGQRRTQLICRRVHAGLIVVGVIAALVPLL
jgi:hypothetical protein